MTYKLVLIRHGESIWNRLDRFTGWADVDLSEQGVKEATSAGLLIKEKGFKFDVVYTSVLKRAIKTSQYLLKSSQMTYLPIIKNWRLNERHYGALQGRNKEESIEEFGEEEVKIWRRDFIIKPPLLSLYDSRHPGKDIRYRDVSEKDLPIGESLADCLERVLPYWQEELKPAIMSGKNLLIAAHGNSLRALVKNIEHMTDEQVINLEIPTGQPLVYELDANSLAVVKKYYLKDSVNNEEDSKGWFSFLNKLKK